MKVFTKKMLSDYLEANGLKKEDITSFTIPDGITEIGEYAFASCHSLESIHIPNSVTEIGDRAFVSCYSLESVDIPDGVTEIGEGAFVDCYSLKSVDIPDSVTEIGEYAFASCHSLESIHISKSVTEISNEVFYDCESLESIEIPDSVTNIGESAFDCCESLKFIHIPNSVTEIGESAFSDCNSLESVNISNSITEIENGVFNGCSSLKSIEIPDSVTKIGESAFEDCHSLESIKIPDGVTKIEMGVFSNCKSLKSVDIPDSVKEIGESAFADCYSLKSIDIPDSVTGIGDYAFSDCKSLESIIIPDDVTKIGDLAFCRCSSLKSVNIPNSVTEIGDNAFDGCCSLKSIEIPDSVTEIGYRTFDGCVSLESVHIPDSVTEIDRLNFRDCHSLESITYKNHNIKPFLYYDCYGEDNFDIIKKLTEHDMLKDNIFPFAVDAAHRDCLDEFCSDYRDFGTLSISKALRNYPDSLKIELKDLFKENKRTGCRVPKCLDKLAMASHIGNISPQDIVNSFSIAYTKDLLTNIKPFVPGIVCGAYYPKSTCDMLYEKGVQDMVANALIGYGSSKDIRFKNVADFIVSHPDTSTDILNKISDNPKDFDITENTTVDNIKQEILRQENMGEVHKINKEYGIDINDCVCNIPVISSKYNDRVSRILDFSNPDDIAIGANLGYATNCCQHLNAAGETAMMHGFLNPDAGFFVIEDKNGKIKAQAEIWLANKNTLVFDNIEFANTSSERYRERVDSLRGDLVAFAEKLSYKNIVMGCGYNEFETDKMEKASKPKLKLTAEEVYLMQEDNDAGVSFKNIKQAEEYMATKKYKASDFVYSDIGKCVYIKHDNQVSPYLMEGYDKELLQEDEKSVKCRNRLDSLDAELGVSQDSDMDYCMSI